MRHWSNLRYLIQHKWFVFQAMREIGGSIWLALTHDLSKFRPSEWIPYANRFYAEDGSKHREKSPAFDRAWKEHQNLNPHHWQHWVLFTDNKEIKAVEIPRKYVYEMVADWMGTERVKTGKRDCCEWYEKNKDNMTLHPETRKLVEEIIKGVR